MMKRLVSIIVLIASLCITAQAYDARSLPLYLTFSEAIGISSASDIKSASITNINDGKTVPLTSSQTNEIFSGCKGLKMKRTISSTPFSGIVLSLETNTSVSGFYLNSGIQIGKFGNNNYICYVPEETNEYVAKIKSVYYEASSRNDMYTFPINEGIDFLKLTAEEWAIPSIKDAADKSLLPYRLTSDYGKNITREEFCILMGNMIAVNSNYKSISDYMRDSKTVYQKNYFTDCANADSAVDILHTLGIVGGKTETLFEPDSFIAREEAAKMISKSAELFIPLYTSVKTSFADNSDISEWAGYYVQWCNEHSIMTGDEKHRFLPKSNFTVAEAIITVSRLYDMIQRNQ